MPVDKALLESCIAEAAGDDADMITYLRDRYAKNDAAAARFVGGFTRTADYTQKSQTLASERASLTASQKQLEARAAQAEKNLEAAEADKNKMMKDLAAGRITVAKAQEIGRILTEKYDLTDEDLPGISDLIATAKTHKVVDRSDDLDARLTSLREEITKELEGKFVKSLGTELGAMSDLDVIWSQIMYDHEQLTGKRITSAEQREILNLARSGDMKDEYGNPIRNLVGVWEKKFNIAGDDGLRMKKRDEKLRSDWEGERTKRDAEERSKHALETVTGGNKAPDFGDGPGISAAFKTNFRTYEMDPSKPGTAAGDGIPSLQVMPGQHVRRTGDRGPSGGQRAAQKFIEQRSGAGTKVTSTAA
jgi:hypothetical protein